MWKRSRAEMMGHSQTKERATGNPNLSLNHRAASRLHLVMGSWDHSVDFLVVGSGAARLTAALRAHDLGGEVLVVEKASLFGGNTAISGGVIWVPDNPSMRAAGIADSLEEGLCYR